jgi:hypothetical protein
MTDTRASQTTVISRRGLLRDAAFLAGGAVVASGLIMSRPAAAGPSKMPQKVVRYQATPNGAARCDSCTLWQGPSACKVVDGTISPSGWCSLYVHRS